MQRAVACSLSVLGLAIFFAASVNGAAIVGLDYGSQFSKVAVIRAGWPIEIALNVHSKRKSESLIAFNGNKRLYGKDAGGFASRKPEMTFAHVRDLIGRNDASEELAWLKAHNYAYDMVEKGGSADDASTSFVFPMKHDSATHSNYSADTLTAMLLEQSARVAKEHMKDDNVVKDFVITVPSFFNQFERQAIIDAAEIAGLRILSLIDENTAAALQYGIDRVFVNSTHKLLLFNMGAKSTQVALVHYNGKYKKRGAQNITEGRLAVVAKAWDRHLGGEDFTNRIMQKMCDEFNKQLAEGEDVRDSARAVARIRKQAVKVKTVLSANEKIPFRIEGLYKGKDLSMQLSRSEFEELSADLFERIAAPIERVLKESGTSLADVDAIELVGGGVRVPKVKKVLKGIFGEMELGNHLNGDEAMALGAVFRGANVSTAFRVRHVGLTDVTPAAIGVRLAEIDANVSVLPEGSKPFAKRASLFKKNTPMDAKKVVAFHHERSFQCTLHYQGKNKTTGESVAAYEITGVEAANEKYGRFGAPKVALVFHLDASGISKLLKAEATFVEEYTVEVREKKQKKKKKKSKSKKKSEASDESTEKAAEKPSGDDAKKEEDATETKGDEPKAIDPETASDSTPPQYADSAEKSAENESENAPESSPDTVANATNDETDSKAAKEDDEPEMKLVNKTRTHRVKLDIVRTDTGVKRSPMGKKEIKTAAKILTELKKMDSARLKRERIKNELESFVFSSRDRLRSNEDAIAKVATEDSVEKLFADLEETEEWLDDSGEDVTAQDFIDRKANLAKVVDSLFTRVLEMKQRPKAVASAKRTLKLAKSRLKSFQADRPWISNATIEAGEATINRVYGWLKQKQKQQSALSARDDPAFTISDVRAKLSLVQTMWEGLMKTRKPYIPKPKKTKKKGNTTSQNSTGEEAVAEDEVSESGEGFSGENGTEADLEVEQEASSGGGNADAKPEGEAAHDEL